MSKELMGMPFDPRQAVIVRFLDGGRREVKLPSGLENHAPGIWASGEVKGVVFNDRGVSIVNERGELERPPRAIAVNVAYEKRRRELVAEENAAAAARAAVVEKHLGWRKGFYPADRSSRSSQ